MRFKVIVNDADLTAEFFEKFDGQWECVDSIEFSDIDDLGFGLHEWMTDNGCEPDGCRIYDISGRTHAMSLV